MPSWTPIILVSIYEFNLMMQRLAYCDRDATAATRIISYGHREGDYLHKAETDGLASMIILSICVFHLGPASMITLPIYGRAALSSMPHIFRHSSTDVFCGGSDR